MLFDTKKALGDLQTRFQRLTQGGALAQHATYHQHTSTRQFPTLISHNQFPMKTLFMHTLIALTFTTHGERLVLVGVSYGKNLLAITDADGKVIWQYKTAGPQRGHTGHHDVHLLPNGNILFRYMDKNAGDHARKKIDGP